MVAVAQAASKESAAAKAAAKPAGISPLFDWADAAPIQRKTCPCGGGCPRCQGGGAQAKLRLSQPGDAAELEADRMAEAAVAGRQPQASALHAAEPAVQRKCACQGSGEECAECQAAHGEEVQRKAADRTDRAEVPAAVLDVSRSPGQPLDRESRGFFESRFGRDFGDVRVHTGADSVRSASELSALAYTVGNHIVFGRDQYAPHAEPGKKLLAHELAHTIQQRGEMRAVQRSPAPTSIGEKALDPKSDREEQSGTEDRTPVQPWTSRWVTSNFNIPQSIADALVAQSNTSETFNGGPFTKVVPLEHRGYFYDAPDKSYGAPKKHMFTDTDLEHLAHKVGLVRVPDSTPFSTGLAGVRGEFLQIGMARVLYAVRAARIPADALSAIASGDLSSAQAAASAVAARRSLEASTRTELPGWLAEMNAQRNISKPGYGGDPLGPRDLEQARVGKNGLIKSDAEVIESAGRANPGYTTAGAALGDLAMAASILSAMAMAHTNDEFGYVDVFPYRIVTDPSKLPNGTRVKDFLTGELYTVSAGVLWCISCRSSRDPI